MITLENKLKSFVFIKSSDSVDLYTDYFYFVFIGRSNVGKSSFINWITNNKKIARTSKKPGATKMFNIYQNDEEKIIFVDTPGYGYSINNIKNHLLIEKWIINLFNDLSQNNIHYHIIQLIDCNVPLTKNDLEVNEMLNSYNLDNSFLFTKSDRLKQKTRHALFKKCENHNINKKDVILISIKKNNKSMIRILLKFIKTTNQ